MNMMRNFFGGGNPGMGLPGPLSSIQNLVQRITSFGANPIGNLLGMNVNIPQNLQNNYEGIANYLVNSGRMTPQQLEQYKQWAGGIEKFLPRR